MTTVQITIPDELARDAERAGLLSSESIEQLLREQLRRQAGQELRAVMDKLSADGTPEMTPEEIQAEIDACRAEQRAARRSNS